MSSRSARGSVALVYTPKDFELNVIMNDLVTLVDPAGIAAE
ncbi:hypothetical protein [uncultured Litoreibacter sp.]|nr:hypothetical protein [uncultured Litoreibacter sp.]